MKSVYSPHRKQSAPTILFTPNNGAEKMTPIGEGLISDLLVAVGHLKVVFESNLCLGVYRVYSVCVCCAQCPVCVLCAVSVSSVTLCMEHA